MVPHCPVLERCGGCPLLPLSEEAQRAHKLDRVRSLRGDPELVIGWVSTTREAYRRRIRMRVDDAGRATFFNEDKLHDCLVLTRPLVSAIERVRALTLRGATHVEVRAPDMDGRPGLFVAGPGVDAPGFVVGEGWQRWKVTDQAWSYVPLDAFLQVHEATNLALVAAIASEAKARGCAAFFDAYAGAGNHALALAAAGLQGSASDHHAGAIRALAAAAKEQELAVETRVGDASECVAQRVDLLVCNPPRAGLRDAASVMASVGAPHVALVTCTPEALVRDLGVFEEHGYRLEQLTAFDMFPHTQHVELLTWLTMR